MEKKKEILKKTVKKTKKTAEKATYSKEQVSLLTKELFVYIQPDGETFTSEVHFTLS